MVGHMERMNDSRLVKRMYSGECVGNRPAGRPKRKWIESVNECLKERNVSLAEARIKVHDRREWRGRPKKKWIESVNECLKERNLSLVEARRKVYKRSEWRGIVRGYGCGPPGPRDEPYIDDMP